MQVLHKCNNMTRLIKGRLKNNQKWEIYTSIIVDNPSSSILLIVHCTINQPERAKILTKSSLHISKLSRCTNKVAQRSSMNYEVSSVMTHVIELQYYFDFFFRFLDLLAPVVEDSPPIFKTEPSFTSSDMDDCSTACPASRCNIKSLSCKF